MRHSATSASILALLAWACLAAPLRAATPAPSQPPQVEAVRATGALRIDGVLDDDAWTTALVIDEFVQQLPLENAPPTERTEVRILYDDHAIYLAIRCYDSNPAAIQVGSLLRDDFAQTSGEQIAFAIDSTNSGRDGFWFSSNPGGAQLDAQIVNEGQIFDRDWDGVWESAGRIDAAGWTLEIRLPFFNLRFPKSDATVMRFNFFRSIRHKNEEVYSPFIPRNYQGTFSFSLGRPVLFRDLVRDRRLDLKPYGLLSARSDFEEDEVGWKATGELGIDLKWRITPNYTADFTVNPDFAQVEADDARINLTRFPLFFPEKREFFLENAGLFSLGRPQETQAFFSRRIGLDADGQTVPLIGGVRVTGRSGPWSIGALDVVADETAGQPQTNFAVGRVKRDVGARSTVGAIITDRHESGGGGNRLGGADARFVYGQDLFWETYAMASRDSGEDTQWSARSELRKNGDIWRWSAGASLVDELFSPGIGFVRRAGIQRADGTFAYRPRPASIPSVRQFTFEAAAGYVASRPEDSDLDSGILDRTLTVGQRTEFETGDQLGAFYEQRFERLTEEFEIIDGVAIPPGDYDNTAVELNFATWRARRLAGSGFVNHGDFFDGQRTIVGVGLVARFNRHISLESSFNRNRVRMPFGDFDTNLWINRLKFAFTPNLFGSALIQWNDLTDDIDLNLRVDWIHMPGADLFVVYNESYSTDPAPGEPRSNGREAIVKLTWLFQF